MHAVQKARLALIAAALGICTWTSAALAQFGGPIPALPGTADAGGDIRNQIESTLKYVLSFLAFLAVIVIVVAGIRLIVSQGEDQSKEKAKKAIFYAVIGLIIVLFARVIVALVTQELPQVL